MKTTFRCHFFREFFHYFNCDGYLLDKVHTQSHRLSVIVNAYNMKTVFRFIEFNGWNLIFIFICIYIRIGFTIGLELWTRSVPKIQFAWFHEVKSERKCANSWTMNTEPMKKDKHIKKRTQTQRIRLINLSSKWKLILFICAYFRNVCLV